jgi:hypothetical protein
MLLFIDADLLAAVVAVMLPMLMLPCSAAACCY